LLVPVQPSPTGPVEWDEIRVTGEDKLAVKASRKLRTEELLITELGGPRLALELDRVPLWRGEPREQVSVRQLMEDFAQYVYLPRLKDSHVLLDAIRDGVARIPSDLAYADAWDDATQRYRGLTIGQRPAVTPSGLVVHPEAARRQLDAEEAERKRQEQQHRGDTAQVTGGTRIENGREKYDPGTGG